MKNSFRFNWIVILISVFNLPHLALSQEKGINLSSPFSQAKFVPDISLIIDFSIVGRNQKNEMYEGLEIPGFTHVHADGHAHAHLPLNAKKGFNLNYGELSLYSIVDPYFDLFATFHLIEASFEVEEAYFTTRNIPLGLQMKAGKFLSSFGRLNDQHTHYWDFANSPLVYRAFFGDHNLLEKGMRITWLTPAPFYLLVGSEMFMGENETSFGTEGFRDATGTYEIDESDSPELYTAYLKTSFDIKKISFLLGGSMVRGKTRTNHGVDDSLDSEGHAVYGTTHLFGFDLTVKYLIQSYFYLTWQTEYLFRNVSGNRFDTGGGKSDLDKTQSGFYSQFLFRLGQRWRTGVRYDLLQKNDIQINGVKPVLPQNLSRYTATLEFNPSEFVQIRFQFSQDRSVYRESVRKINHELILQFNLAIGAHGAHAF